jgi:hypothetical protein
MILRPPRPLYYILEGRTPKPIDDEAAFSRWYGKLENRRVARTEIGEITVSTIFLGSDHNHVGDGPPILFETEIFGGPHSEAQWRCETYEEAEEQHEAVVAFVQASAR